MRVDYLIVGAGFAGCTLAERIASQLGKRVLLVEKRNHIGGNAYDYFDQNGVLVHRYGPHIFHTNSTKVWEYLSRFTEWRPYYHHALAVVDGKKVPVPFNLNSLAQLFPERYADKLASLLLAEFGIGARVPVLKLLEHSNSEVKALAEYIYQRVFRGYTLKQWDLRPEELDASVTARVPVVISRDDRYFQDTYQAMPLRGYTEMFMRMLAHPNIKVLLNTDYKEIIDDIRFDRMVYTGPIDAFFDGAHGHLPYRSLRFELRYQEADRYQEVGTVNYPNEFAFTRSTEFKHLTGQRVAGTTVAVEYPEPYVPGENEPYYPIPQEQNRSRYDLYAAEAKKLHGSVFFAGRLADYKYYNMDQVVARSLTVFERDLAPQMSTHTELPLMIANGTRQPA
jgi:UDP-galactopyranose mutase